MSSSTPRCNSYWKGNLRLRSQTLNKVCRNQLELSITQTEVFNSTATTHMAKTNGNSTSYMHLLPRRERERERKRERETVIKVFSHLSSDVTLNIQIWTPYMVYKGNRFDLAFVPRSCVCIQWHRHFRGPRFQAFTCLQD